MQSSKSKLLLIFCFEFLFSLITKQIIERTKILFPGFSVFYDNDDVFILPGFFHKYCYSFLSCRLLPN